MKGCQELYFLSTIACMMAEGLSEKELEGLAVNLRVLGEMLEVILNCRVNREGVGILDA